LTGRVREVRPVIWAIACVFTFKFVYLGAG
jgi:AGZA family xanthine/uracil permease-like MFS transporter